METTRSNAANMQSLTSVDTLPPTVSASFASHLAHIPAEISSPSSNEAGGRGLKSLWIQRLKASRDELVMTAKGSIPSCTGTQVLHPVGCHFQQRSPTQSWEHKPSPNSKASGGDQAMLELRNNASPDTRLRSLMEQQKDYGVERRAKSSEQGRISLNAMPSSTGFVRCSNLTADARTDERLQAEPMAPNMNGKNSRMQGNIPASSERKPPLPLAHSELGFPPRPSSHKIQGSSSQYAGRVACSLNKGSIASQQTESVTPASILAVNGDIRSVLLEHGVKEVTSNKLSKENKVSSSGVPAVEPVERQFLENEGLSSSLMSRQLKKITKQDLEGTSALALGLETSKNDMVLQSSRVLNCTPSVTVSGIGDAEPPFSKPPEVSITQNPSHESSKEISGLGRADEKTESTPSASTTASFPWEMFVEAAGPSKSAREEFVEVYNRARFELKNQKASHANRVFDKETENGPGLAYGHGTTNPFVMREGQSSERQSQLLGISKTSGTVQVDGSLDHQAPAWGVNAMAVNSCMSSKEQHCARFLEGKVQNIYGGEAQKFGDIPGCDNAPFQASGSLHNYVQPAVASKNDTLPFEKNDQTASSRINGSEKTGNFQDTNDRQNDARILLSKRQRGILESNSPSLVAALPVQREGFPRQSEVWLQRWYPPYISSTNRVEEKKSLESNRNRHRLARPPPSYTLVSRDGDDHGMHDKRMETKNTLEKGSFVRRLLAQPEPEYLKSQPEKTLPSAAAMAIVGTAARQFCTVQPQQEGTFAFWSGFGMPAPQAPRDFSDKGKRKLSEADPSLQP